MNHTEETQKPKKCLLERKKVCRREIINGALVMSTLVRRPRPVFNECVVQPDVQGDKLITGVSTGVAARRPRLRRSLLIHTDKQEKMASRRAGDRDMKSPRVSEPHHPTVITGHDWNSSARYHRLSHS